MDENKIIRLILEARDNISGPLKNMRANVKKDFDEIDKSFVKSRKGVNLYEDDFVDMTDSVVKGADRATASVNKMTEAIRKAGLESKKAKQGIYGVVQDIQGEVRGRRTIRGADGKFISGKGRNIGDRVLVDDSKKVRIVNREIIDALGIGYRIAKNTQKELDRVLGATKEIRKERLQAAEEKKKNDLIDLSIQQDLRRSEEADIVEQRTRESGLLEKKLELQKKQNAAALKFEESRNESDLESLSRAENEVKFIENRINQIKRDVSTERTRQFQEERQEIIKNYELEKANIKNLTKEDAKRAIDAFKNQRKLLLSRGTSRDQVVKRVGFAAGDFFGGIGRGRSQTRDLDKDLEKLASTFGRLGFAIGSAFRDMNSFVNLRWLFITSTIILFINLLTQLVVVLVSVASSAVLAASALGAAFAGGVAQAIPVVGLLIGAFNELSKAMDAVKLADKKDLNNANDLKDSTEKKTQAIQRLADAHYTVKKAIESVSDAQYALNQSNQEVAKAYEDQKTAVKDLAQARKDAAQDIIDANLQEKDSALALEEAELAVLQAKEKLRQEEERKRRSGADVAGAQAAVKEAQDRLAKAKSEGDNPEILLANQQLSIAQQNLDDIQDRAAEGNNDLKDAQLGVQRAELNRQQAAQRKKKDAQDAQILRQKGVDQADQVLAAEKQLANATEAIADAQRNVVTSQRALADSIHSLAIARREENDAKKALLDTTNFQTAAQENLNEAIADFSPSQKKLFEGLLRVKEAYEKAFVGSKGKNGILAPILDSFTAIADVITELLTDPEVLKAFSTLAKGIGAGIKDLAGVFASKSFKDDLLFFISEAADNLPKVFNIFKNILQIVRDIARAGSPIFNDLLGGLDKLVGRAKNFTSAEGKPSRRPDEGGGVADLGERSPLVKFLQSAEKHLDSWLKLGKAIASVIQALINVSAPTGKGLVESATDALTRLAKYIDENPEEVSKFFEDIANSFKQLSSALLDLAIVFGKAAKDPQIQTFAIFLVETIVPGILLAVKVTGLFFGLLNSITSIPIIGDLVKFAIQLAIMEKTLNKLFPFTQGFTELLRSGLKKALDGLKFAITNPITLFRILQKEIAIATFRLQAFMLWIKRIPAVLGRATIALRIFGVAITLSLGHIGLIILAITAIVTALVLLDRKFHFIRPTINFFFNLMKSIFNWIKDHWRLVTALITGPIGVAVLLIIKHWDKVKRLFFGFKDLLVDKYYKPLYNLLIQPFVEASAFIIKLFKALPGILGKILGKIPFFGRVIKLAEKASGLFGKVVGAAQRRGLAPTKNPIDSAKDALGGAGGITDAAEVALGGEKKKILAGDILDQDLPFHGKLIRRLRSQGLSDVEILKRMIKNKVLLRKNFKKRFGVALTEVQGFGGGTPSVPGRGSGDTVPAMLTPGEMILNSVQQRKLAKKLGISVQQLKAQIFGTNMGAYTGNPGVRGTAGSGILGYNTSKKHSPFLGGSFTLIPQEDDSGETVWFIQLANGTFGQVTDRDAMKIQKSNGKFIPGYVRRNAGGFSQRTFTEMNPLGFANGGIIPRAVRRFAEGGVVQSPGFGNTTNNGATVNQNFNVKTEGSTDWAYVMRLSSITAQSAF